MKWDGMIQTLTASLVKNYTQYGWGLTKAPQALTDEIRQAIYDGLPNANYEHDVDVIDGPTPLFIQRPDLTKKVRSQLTNYIPISAVKSDRKIILNFYCNPALYLGTPRVATHFGGMVWN